MLTKNRIKLEFAEFRAPFPAQQEKAASACRLWVHWLYIICICYQAVHSVSQESPQGLNDLKSGVVCGKDHFFVRRRLEDRIDSGVFRGGWDCRYRSPDTDPNTDPDGAAMGQPMRLRWGCDNSPDGAAIHRPKSGVGVVGRGVGRVKLNCNCNAAASRRKPATTASGGA
jgi:hypothetical protein